MLTVARVSRKVLHSRHDSSEKHILKSRNYIPIVETPYVGEFYLINSLMFTLVLVAEAMVSTSKSPYARKMVSTVW